MKTHLQRRTIRDVASIHSERFVSGPDKGKAAPVTHLQNRFIPEKLQKAKCHVFCIASGKGGTGKTTITTNLAYALSKRGLKVLLLDADLGLANAHLLMGVSPKLDISDVLNGRAKLEDVIIRGESGVELLPGGSGQSELSAIGDDKLRYLAHSLGVLENKWDVALVDLAAGISPQVMRLLEPAHEIILVINPEVTSLMDAYALIKSHAMLYPRQSLTVRFIVNRVRDQMDAIHAYQRIRKVVSKYLNNIRMSMWGYIPYDRLVITSISMKKPMVLTSPRSLAARSIFSIAERLAENHYLWKERQMNGSSVPSYFARLEQQAYEQ